MELDHDKDVPAAQRSRWRRFLTARRLPIWLALIGVLLTLPALPTGLVGDDEHHRLRLLGSDELPELSGDPMKLFVFADGDPAKMERLMDIGVWPWWTIPILKVAFFRPVTVLTHWIDYQLWPNQPWLMHAQSIAWFALLIVAVTVFFRRTLGGLILPAGLAALLYAIDDAHGMPVGFVANRNAVIAAVFGVLCLIAHDRWRRDRWRPGIVLAPLLLLVGLLSAEAAIGTVAYLFAHVVFLDRASRPRRVAVLTMYAAVVIGWRLAWKWMGYGVYGIGLYVDPTTEPLRFLIALLDRYPVMLLGQLFFPPSEIYLLGLALDAMRLVTIAAAVIVLTVSWIIARRLPWDRVNGFFATGMLLAAIPTCTTVPSDRMLFYTGLGAFALIARYLHRVWFGQEEPEGVRVAEPPAPRMGAANTSRAPAPRDRLGRGLAVALIAVHFVIAPILLVARAYVGLAPAWYMDSLKIQIPRDVPIEGRTIVAVTAPAPFLAGFFPEQRALDGLPLPARTRILAPNDVDGVTVTREDERTLTVRPASGFLRLPTDRLARSRHHPMQAGHVNRLSSVTVTVIEMTDDDRPAAVRFAFDIPLEDESLLWLHWTGERYERFTPPPIGAAVTLQPGPPAF